MCCSSRSFAVVRAANAQHDRKEARGMGEQLSVGCYWAVGCVGPRAVEIAVL